MRAANTYRAARREAQKLTHKTLRRLGHTGRGAGVLGIKTGWAPHNPHSENRESARRLRQMEARNVRG